MTFFSRFNPLRAIRDLRAFLAQRKPYEVVFMGLAVAITWTVILVFARDTHVEREYKPDIIYVQSWPLNRSDAEIRAQQAKDLPAERARKAEIERRQKERQEKFKRIDDKLRSWGI